MKIRIGIMKLVLTMLICAGALVQSSAGLTVSTDGTNYTVTARKCWEMKISIANGCIWSFKDLTDAGYDGDHYNYVAVAQTDTHYGKRGLLVFFGRGNAQGHEDGVGGGGGTIPDSGSLTYETAPDGSCFKMTYTETDEGGTGEYLYGGDYSAPLITNGDVITSIEITINEPTPAGTCIDWSMSNFGTRAAGDNQSERYYLDTSAGVDMYLGDDRDVTGPSDGINLVRTVTNGSQWAEASVSDTPLNVSTNGLTAGRTFRLERLTGGPDATFDQNGLAQMSYDSTRGTYVPSSPPAGQEDDGTPLWWAGFDGVSLQDAGGYDATLPGDYVKTQTGFLHINIDGPPAGWVLITR